MAMPQWKEFSQSRAREKRDVNDREDETTRNAGWLAGIIRDEVRLAGTGMNVERAHFGTVQRAGRHGGRKPRVMPDSSTARSRSMPFETASAGRACEPWR